MSGNGSNSWNVSYRKISFLSRILETHGNNGSVTRTQDIIFTVKRNRQEDSIVILCCEEYTLGLITVRRGLIEFDQVNIFYCGGTWTGYTLEAKEFCWRQNIGIYNANEITGGLWTDDYWTYNQRDEKGNNKFYFRNE